MNDFALHLDTEVKHLGIIFNESSLGHRMSKHYIQNFHHNYFYEVYSLNIKVNF